MVHHNVHRCGLFDDDSSWWRAFLLSVVRTAAVRVVVGQQVSFSMSAFACQFVSAVYGCSVWLIKYCIFLPQA